VAVDREAFHGLFTSLPPLRGFIEDLIARRVGSPETASVHRAGTAVETGAGVAAGPPSSSAPAAGPPPG
jgi:hypothetical protein